MSTTEPSHSLHPKDYKNDTEPNQISSLNKNLYSIANKTPINSLEQTEDPDTAKDISTIFGLSFLLTVHSTSKYSYIWTALDSNIPVYYLLIAIVILSMS